jgi:fatty acid desaturase
VTLLRLCFRILRQESGGIEAATATRPVDRVTTHRSFRRRNLMLWTIVVILVVLWLLGFFGGRVIPSIPRTGNVVHVLLVIALILIVLQLLGVVSL